MSERETRRIFAFLPVTLHLETLGGIATPMILRGTPLPAERVQTFSTASEGQNSVEVKILMGESRLAAKNLSVGTFKLSGIPAQARGGPQIHVRFRIDRTCVTTVTAEMVGTDLRAEEKFEPPADMSDEAITKLVSEAEKAKSDDDAVISKIETTNRATQVMATAEARLKKESDTGISKAIADLGLAMQRGDQKEISSRTDKLEGLLSPYPGFNFLEQFLKTQPKPSAPRSPDRSTAAKKSAPKPESQGSGSSIAATKATNPILGRIFGAGQFTLDPTLCFVLMPFEEKFRAIYEDHIRPTVESAGLRCQKADEVVGVKSITRDIWERINSARFLVADLTGRNANVFYEVGLAHALSKDVILITQSMEFVPFDLRSLRCLQYEYTPRGVRAFESTLRSTIDAVMRGE